MLKKMFGKDLENLEKIVMVKADSKEEAMKLIEDIVMVHGIPFETMVSPEAKEKKTRREPASYVWAMSDEDDYCEDDEEDDQEEAERARMAMYLKILSSEY